MTNAIFITVRTSSTRLPNKALLNFQGLPTIEYVIRRMKYSKKANQIILCTTQKKDDDILIEIAKRNNINYFRGSENDKLVRWKDAAIQFNIDFFVTADGDDLFCEPKLLDMAFDQYKRNNSDFIQSKNIICGAFTYGIKVDALKKVCGIKDTDETEMMWVYFTDTGLFRVEELENVPDKFYRDDIRMTVDYQEDYDFFNAIAKKDDHTTSYLTLDKIVAILEKYPKLKEINYFRHKEWADNQDKKINLKLKGGIKNAKRDKKSK